MFPILIVGAGGWELANWAQGYVQYWQEAAEAREGTEGEIAQRHADNAKEFGQHLKDITERHQISYIELTQTSN